jgi:hypothetical protein
MRHPSLLAARLALALSPVACGPAPVTPSDAVSADASDGGTDGARPRGGPADTLLGVDRDATLDRLAARIAAVQALSREGLARLGLTWDASIEAVRPRFRQAESSTDVFYALLALRNALHDVHSRLEVEPPTSERLGPPSEPDVFLPWRVEAERQDDASFAYIVQAVSPAWTEVPVGSRVLSIDGVETARVEREMRTWFAGSSPDGWRSFVASTFARRSPVELPSPRAGESVRITLVPPGERAPRTVTSAWSAAPWSPPGVDPCLASVDLEPAREFIDRPPEFIGINLCVHPTAEPTRKILRWFSFLYGFRDFAGSDPSLVYAPIALRERMRALSYPLPESALPYLPGERAPRGILDPARLGALDVSAVGAWLRRQGVRDLLIDVRENRGGHFDPSWAAGLATRTFRQPGMRVLFGPGLREDPSLLDRAEAGPQARLAQGYLLDHPEAAQSPLYPFICRSAACSESELDIAPSADPWGVRAVLLTGPGCVSACDTWASLLADNGLATVAGLPSEGADSPVRIPVELPLSDGASVVTMVLTVGVSYRGDGATVQGHPPVPSCPVAPSAAHRGGYLNAVLEACR